MNEIARTPEPPQPRAETSRAPRGEELQQASSRFAELMAKERKETRSPKSERDRTENKKDEAGESVDSEGRAESNSGLPYGIHLSGERGQGSQQNRSRQRAFDPTDLESANGQSTGEQVKALDDPSSIRCKLPPETSQRPESFVHADYEFDGRLGARVNLETASEQPLPTPGDLLLKAFSRTNVDAPVESPTPVADVDAIRRLGEQIAERILISRTESAGTQEMLIQLKDSVLPGTEVRMARDGERIQITLVTDHASSFHLLAAKQADLQAKLGDGVVVQLSFDPEGMISQQRMERPLAAQSSQQSGDGRERDSDDRRRDKRRDQSEDRDS